MASIAVRGRGPARVAEGPSAEPDDPADADRAARADLADPAGRGVDRAGRGEDRRKVSGVSRARTTTRTGPATSSGDPASRARASAAARAAKDRDRPAARIRPREKGRATARDGRASARVSMDSDEDVPGPAARGLRLARIVRGRRSVKIVRGRRSAKIVRGRRSVKIVRGPSSAMIAPDRSTRIVRASTTPDLIRVTGQATRTARAGSPDHRSARVRPRAHRRSGVRPESALHSVERAANARPAGARDSASAGLRVRVDLDPRIAIGVSRPRPVRTLLAAPDASGSRPLAGLRVPRSVRRAIGPSAARVASEDLARGLSMIEVPGRFPGPGSMPPGESSARPTRSRRRIAISTRRLRKSLTKPVSPMPTRRNPRISSPRWTRSRR